MPPFMRCFLERRSPETEKPFYKKGPTGALVHENVQQEGKKEEIFSLGEGKAAARSSPPHGGDEAERIWIYRHLVLKPPKNPQIFG